MFKTFSVHYFAVPQEKDPVSSIMLNTGVRNAKKGENQ
jgi:hypothetical protein